MEVNLKIGIDLGGSHIGIAIIDNGKILEKNEIDIQYEEGIKEKIEWYLKNEVGKFIEKYKIEQIGVAAPGNPKDNCIKNIVNLKIDELNIDKILGKYGIKTQIINDAKAAAIAEKEYGALKQFKDCVFLCLGTGIGGAVFFNNNLLKAIKNPGFELGHMIIDKNGLPCNCGKNGCFETYCSIKRFKHKAQKVLNLDEITSKELLDEIVKNKQNKKIDELINNFINDLIIGLSNVIDIFEPEAIALGGGFVYFKDIFYDKLVHEMDSRKYVFNKDSNTKIVLAKLGNDAGMIGATL